MKTATTRDPEQIRRGCNRFLNHHYPASPRETLLALADAVDAEAEPDQYGKGDIIEQFETRIAALLGKEAAVFMPSGAMCQQIALRIWTGRHGVPAVAMHPRNHLDRQEHFAYQRLHHLTSIPIGSLDSLATIEDLDAIAEPVGALLLELPQRELGGRLPVWDDLVAMTTWARDRGIAVHMDGARLWESQPFYDRPHADIAALFDSVYVSFYKGLGGLAGSALAGPEDVIAEARVWQRRHGGNLIRLYPYVVSAQIGVDRHLHHMETYWRKAQDIAAALEALPEIVVVPNPPQTNMMHLFFRATNTALQEAMLTVAEQTGVWLFSRVQQSLLPDYQWVELSAGEATLDIPTDEIVSIFRAILAEARRTNP